MFFFFLQMAGHEVFPNNWLLVHRTWYNCKTWGFRMQKKLHITRRHDGCTSLFEAIEATVIWCYLLVDPSNYGYIPSGNFTGWWFGTWLLWLSIHIGNVIIPTDELIFQRGRAQPPTSLGKQMFSELFAIVLVPHLVLLVSQVSTRFGPKSLCLQRLPVVLQCSS